MLRALILLIAFADLALYPSVKRSDPTAVKTADAPGVVRKFGASAPRKPEEKSKRTAQSGSSRMNIAAAMSISLPDDPRSTLRVCRRAD
jgi:hypothetical protein